MGSRKGLSPVKFLLFFAAEGSRPQGRKLTLRGFSPEVWRSQQVGDTCTQGFYFRAEFLSVF